MAQAQASNDPKPCRNCGGREWVCENHRDRPWNINHPEGCECGAGAPCPVCNSAMANAHLLDLLERARAGADEALAGEIDRALAFYHALEPGDTA